MGTAHDALRSQKPVTSDGGMRPAPLVDVSPYVQILDAPVPQVEDHALEFFRRLDLPVAEQVIDVPKISSSSCPSRASLNEPQQVVEQLVEVPTLLSVAVLQQRTAEQLASIPVPRGRGQGFLPEQSSTAISSSGKRISERTVSGSLTFLLVVAWDTGLPHLLVLQMRILLGFFALFPRGNKCDTTSALEVGTASTLEPIHAGNSAGVAGGGGGGEAGGRVVGLSVGAALSGGLGSVQCS